MLNVAGSMVSAIMVDKWEGTFDKQAFLAPLNKKMKKSNRQWKRVCVGQMV